VTRLCLSRAVTTTPSFGDRVRGGETVYGGWTTIAGPISCTMLTRAGLDYVVIDLQHGEPVERDVPGMTAAIRLGGAAPLARVRHAHPADIGRALDMGCEGVIVPNVESADEAAEVAGACRFPPDGYRSGGGVLAPATLPLCIIMVESQHALDELPATLRLPGVDAVYIGPRDLAYSLGCAYDPHDPVLRAAFERFWAMCAAAGKPCGVHALDGETARIYRDNGCKIVTVIQDGNAVTRAATAALAAARP
jgi:4-hydroxy-2-oxoheptanedioate aldolase